MFVSLMLEHLTEHLFSVFLELELHIEHLITDALEIQHPLYLP